MILDFEKAEAEARKRGGEFEYACVGDDCRPSLERQAQDAVAQARKEERARPIRCENHRRPDFSLFIVESEGELGAAVCWLCVNEIRAEERARLEQLVQALANVPLPRCEGTNEDNDTCGVTFTCQACLTAQAIRAAVERERRAE